MTDSINNSLDLDDWTNLDISINTWKNQRIAVRYVREDIIASICKISSLSFSLFSKDIFIVLVDKKKIPVELMDISSKGVLIATHIKLKVNKKITLTLEFEDSKAFKIYAKVVRKSREDENHYGVKFDHLNNDLGDYLLKTQSKLVFK